MPEEATTAHPLRATENSRSPAQDYPNKKPLREQSLELEHLEVAMQRPTRRSRFQRQATRLPHTPDTEIFRLQEQEWILKRKRARKNRCKIWATRQTHSQCLAVNPQLKPMSSVRRIRVQ